MTVVPLNKEGERNQTQSANRAPSAFLRSKRLWNRAGLHLWQRIAAVGRIGLGTRYRP